MKHSDNQIQCTVMSHPLEESPQIQGTVTSCPMDERPSDTMYCYVMPHGREALKYRVLLRHAPWRRGPQIQCTVTSCPMDERPSDTMYCYVMPHGGEAVRYNVLLRHSLSCVGSGPRDTGCIISVGGGVRGGGKLRDKDFCTCYTDMYPT